MRLICLFVVHLFVRGAVTQQHSTYRAAVVEYANKVTAGRSIRQNLEDNVQEYIYFIQQAAAQDAQIIVFPEYGLTGWNFDPSSSEEISTPVADEMQKISPCQSDTNYAQFLVDLSCAVQRYRIYTVVNVLESSYDNKQKMRIYYNTNVAFDRQGVIIARYRKINLFDEPHVTPGPHAASTFATDFGVTFGMFICFDIAFQSPAQDVLGDRLVTDIAYSTAWLSELPFFQANSMQHGYAKSNAVNLLASGLNDPSKCNGGSGIYLSDGRIEETYISGDKRSKLMVHDVPIIRLRRNTTAFCQSSSGMPRQGHQPGVYVPDTNLFHTIQGDLTAYTFKSLNLNERAIEEEICSGDSDFCCEFHITVNKQWTTWPTYVYKLVAFYGVRRVSQTKTMGLRNCGLVACVNDTNASCGGRNLVSPTGVTFESITVKGTFNPKDSHYQPATLKNDLTPTTNYMYCVNTIDDDEVEISMTSTKSHDSLLTFGIVGRVFINDDMPPGPIDGAQARVFNVYLVLIASVLVLLQKLVLIG